MPNHQPVFSAQCACGQTAFEGKGRPIMRIACYCRDCQAVAKQIDALPGKSGLGPDAGTVSSIFRKDLVRCVRGEERLIEHKLQPSSKTTRLLAACCNSNMLSRFEQAFPPMVALRTHIDAASIRPDVLIHTRSAPDPARIIHSAPRHAGIPASLVLKLIAAQAELLLLRVAGDGRVY
jgi:hypothetical protein